MKNIIFLFLTIPIITFSQNKADITYQKAEDSFNKGDYSSAFDLYKNSSDEGNTQAKLNLSYMYSEGIGTDKDEVKSSVLYEQCYNNGYSGYTDVELDEYNAGGFDDLNTDKSYYWTTQLYTYNQEEALKKLGWMYVLELVKDKKKLEYIYNLLIKHSENDCNYQFYIGLMYHNGDYLIKNKQKAKDWFQMSLENGCDFINKLTLD
jgi:TPR repeat protein